MYVTKAIVKYSLSAILLAGVAITSFAAAPAAPSARLLAKADPWVVSKLADGSASQFLIVLPQQADLSAAAELPDKTQRGQWVLDTLRTHAERTQASLRALLSLRGVEHQAFWVANMVLVRGDAVLAEELAARPDVARLAANPSVRLALPPAEATSADLSKATTAIEWGVTKIHAPDLWTAGFTGQGIVVAGADTGYDWTHPAIKGKYRGWNGSTVNHNFNWHDAIHVYTLNNVCPPSSTTPCDDDRHGTHTMGTMVGDDGAGNQIGVAPGARWIGCRNMDQGNGTPATYAECFQWFIAPTDQAGNNANPALAPHVINNSWGCPVSEGCTDPNVLRTVVESVRAAGILVVASAGNEGPGCSSVGSPIATYEASLSVGATDPSDTLANFSSRGPVTADGSNRLKPEVSAPGVSVRSSVPGSGYSTLSGTSMAGPHVVGGAALLMSAYPALIGKTDLVQSRLIHSAVPHAAAVNCGNLATAVPNNEYGWGRLDVKAAYDAPFAVLDVDHNGVAEASKDGLLILRYLLGFRGNALISGAVGAGARRTLVADIETYLASMLQ